jgi:Putative metal-binding motif/Secretion system C-terminal sorting domain
MRNISSLFIFIFCFLWVDSAFSQNVRITATSGTLGPTNYTTLKNALTAINNGTHKGAVTVRIKANISQGNLESILYASGTGSALYTSVLIRPEGGSFTITGNTLDDTPLLTLDGADNITIDGLNNGGNALSFNSTDAQGILLTNGATNCTIRNCQFSTTDDFEEEPSIHLWSSNSTYANSNNIIDKCLFTSSGEPSILGEISNINTPYNNYNLISNCSFYNTIYPIKMYSGNVNWSILGNKFYHNQYATSVFRGISVNGFTNCEGFDIRDNVFGFNAPDSTGFTILDTGTNGYIGIDIQKMSTNLGLISKINGNLFSNYAIKGSVLFTGINVLSGVVEVGATQGNTFTNIKSATDEFILYVQFVCISLTSNSTCKIKNNTFSNFNIQATLHNGGDFTLKGISVNLLNGVNAIIENNTIGTTTAPCQIINKYHKGLSIIGIDVIGGTTTVTNNIISNLKAFSRNNASQDSFSVIGLRVRSTTGTLNSCNINNNIISDLNQLNDSMRINLAGMVLRGGSSPITCSNNSIYNFKTNSLTDSTRIYGIFMTGSSITLFNNTIALGDNHTSAGSLFGILDKGGNAIYHNAVFINGATAAAPNSHSAAMKLTTNESVVKNNQLVNMRTGEGSHVAIHFESLNAYPTTINNNNYVVGLGNLILAKYNTTSVVNLSSWQLITAQELNSLSIAPTFYNATSLAPNLRVVGGYTPALNNSGTPITLVAFDIDNLPRNTLTPDIGINEFDTNIIPCTGVVNLVNTVANSTQICLPDPLVLTNTDIQTQPGIIYQWAVSNSSTGIFTPIEGITNKNVTLTPANTGIQFYQLSAQCGSNFYYSQVLQVEAQHQPQAIISYPNPPCKDQDFILEAQGNYIQEAYWTGPFDQSFEGTTWSIPSFDIAGFYYLSTTNAFCSSQAQMSIPVLQTSSSFISNPITGACLGEPISLFTNPEPLGGVSNFNSYQDSTLVPVTASGIPFYYGQTPLLPIGFDFFILDEFRATQHGYIYFSNSEFISPNYSFEHTNSNINSHYALIASLWTTSLFSDSIYIETRGVTPHRVLVIEFRSKKYGSTFKIRHQIHIHENTGRVKLMYRNESDPLANYDNVYLQAVAGIKTNNTGINNMTFFEDLTLPIAQQTVGWVYSFDELDTIEKTIEIWTHQHQFDWQANTYSLVDTTENIIVTPPLGTTTFTVTITNTNNCTATASTTVEILPVLDLTFQKQDPTCYNQANGILTGIPINGTDHIFSWYNGQSVSTLTQLGAGAYTLTVTALGTCNDTVSNSVSLINPLPVEWSIDAITPPTCFGNQNGSIQLTTTNTTPPLIFNINSPDGTFENLNSQTFQISLIDSLGCQDSTQVTVPEGLPIFNYYIDTDQDGYGWAASLDSSCILPAGSVLNDDDCNDLANTINPVALEICNLSDDNCNGDIDEGLCFPPNNLNTFLVSGEGAVISWTPSTCATGYRVQRKLSTATNWSNIAIITSTQYQLTGLTPGASYLWRLQTQCGTTFSTSTTPQPFTTLSCFGAPIYYSDHDHDGFAGLNEDSLYACSQPQGYLLTTTDCNDNNPSINPLALEICNLLDDNCNASIDETVACPAISTYSTIVLDTTTAVLYWNQSPCAIGYTLQYKKATSTSFTNIPNVQTGNQYTLTGLLSNQNYVWRVRAICTTNTSISSQTQAFSTQCPNAIQWVYADLDNDGFGNPNTSLLSCNTPVGFVPNSTDCNDALNTVNPGIPEKCDGLDNNCDNMVDNNVVSNPTIQPINVDTLSKKIYLPSPEAFGTNSIFIRYRSNNLGSWTSKTINAAQRNQGYYVLPICGSVAFQLRTKRCSVFSAWSSTQQANFSCGLPQALKQFENEQPDLLSAFPNPVIDYLQISVSNQQTSQVTISIFRSDGSFITRQIEQPIQDAKYWVDFRAFPSGVYILHIITDQANNAIQIIKS